MTLRRRPWERRLKRRVRAELRAAPALWREFKRHRRGHRWWHRRLPPQFARVIYWAGAFTFLARGGVTVDTMVTFIWLWALGATFWRTAQLQSTLYFAPQLQLFRHLPIADADIFEVLWRRFLRKSCWPALDFAMLYGVLAFRLGAGWQTPVWGLTLGGLQALFNVGFAVLAFGSGWRRGLPLLAALCFGGALSLVVFSGSGSGPGLSGLSWLPPSGWIFYALGVSTGPDLLPNLLAGVALAAFPWALQRLRRRYVLTEDVLNQAFRLTAAGEAGALRLQEYAANFSQPASTVAAALQAGALRERLDWTKAGWVEGWVARGMTPRERDVVEYLTAGQPNWSKAFRTLLIMGVVALLLIKFLPALAGFGLFFVIAYGGVAIFGLGQTFGRGFTLAAPVALPPPYYAYLPLGFAELHRCVLKVMLLRFALLTPVLWGLIAAFKAMAGPMEVGFWPITFKVWGLILLAHPALAIFAFSASTNDTSRGSVLLAAVGCILLLLGCGIAALVFPHWSGASLAAAGFALVSWGAKWLYQQAYNSGRFDLFPAKRSETQPIRPA